MLGAERVIKIHVRADDSAWIYQSLMNMAVVMNRKRVERIMCEERLVAKAAKFCRREVLSGNSCIKADNRCCGFSASVPPKQ